MSTSATSREMQFCVIISHCLHSLVDRAAVGHLQHGSARSQQVLGDVGVDSPPDLLTRRCTVHWSELGSVWIIVFLVSFPMAQRFARI